MKVNSDHESGVDTTQLAGLIEKMARRGIPQ
jgi:hypothetical protein